MVAMRRFHVDPNRIGTVFVSHLHGDHFGGLPFMILDGQFYSGRTTPLTLVGPPGLRERLTQAMEVLFPGSSKVERKFVTEIRELAPETSVTIDGVTAIPYTVEHLCGAPPFAYRFACDGKVLAYTGDTEWTDKLLAVGRDADLLVAEALSFEKKIKYHLDYATLKAGLARIGARRVILTHMGPEMLAHRAAEIYERIGRMYTQAKEYDKAVKAYQEAGRKFPEASGRLNFHLAQLSLDLGKHAEALKYVDGYLRLQPQGAEAYEMKIALLAKVGKSADAVPWLEQTTQADPFNVTVKSILAREYGKAGQHARKHCRLGGRLHVVEEADRALVLARVHVLAGEEVLDAILEIVGERDLGDGGFDRDLKPRPVDIA